MKIKDVEIGDLAIILDAEENNFKEDAFDKRLMIELIYSSTFFLKLIDEQKQNVLLGYSIGFQDQPYRINLIDFLIRKKFQNKGYGSFLLEYTIQKVKRMENINQIVLNVNTENIPAIRLYTKYNFKIVQKIENYYHHDQSAYFMSLHL